MKRLIALILMLVLASIVSAQDATQGTTFEAPVRWTATAAAEVTEQDVTIVATETSTDVPAGPVVVVDADGEGQTPVDPDEPWWAKYVAQLLIFGGLMVGALRGLNLWLKSRVNNKPFMDSIEYGYRAITPDTVESGIDTVLTGLAVELEEFGGNASKFLRQLGTKGDVIAQKVDEAKQAKL